MGKGEKKSKKKHKKSKHKERRSENSSSSSEEWVEKDLNTIPQKNDEVRDEWMSLPSSFSSISNTDRRKEREEVKQKERETSKYDPRTNIRELNPYWKKGGDGLPTQKKTLFRKPEEDLYSSYKNKSSRGNWRKKSNPEPSSSKVQNDSPRSIESKSKLQPESSDYLTDKEMNEIAAKIVKAEILGNDSRVKELKKKLDRAREIRKNTPTNKDENNEEGVILYRTDSKGFTRPLNAPETSSHKRRNKVETHESGKRQKYFADDDKYSLNQMFENEKFNTSDQDAEFVRLTAKVSKMDDMDDMFVDKIRDDTTRKAQEKEKSKAMVEHHRRLESLENCERCLQSKSVNKHLLVSLGETVYLSLPPHEPLTDGHCLLIPTRHVSCSTQLDENEWTDMTDFRRALTNMFKAQDEDVIFYETILNSHSYSHMALHCVPVPKEQGDLAPIYFKKAIDECETEWSTNKKLINLTGKDVRRAVPKGLPYFFVSFGMNEGYAHVIEDQRYFPKYFAAEIIGGILDLHHSKWRNPRKEKFDIQKARLLEFTNKWKTFDCTV